jgi:hypothetical protein
LDRFRPSTRLALLALLCCVAYVPLLRIPLIEDDYPSLAQAQTLGAPSHVWDLLFHSAFQARATSVWSMYLLWKAFALTPWVYHLASLLLHIVNTWLVYGICRGRTGMRQAAFWAAAFFAVAEGHQEAVMWFTAINELWMFLFGAAALLCWMHGRKLGILLFALALLSKESAVIFLPLFLLAAPGRRNWRDWAPYVALATLMTGSIFLGRSFRFSDGSFSLHAPFWITWPRGFGRVLWIWGWIAALLIWFRGDVKQKRSALFAGAWIIVALLPYIFLTYSTEIPSRQTYLASVGLAMLVGLAFSTLDRRAATAALAVAILAHNVGYVWVKKRAQFLERAAPTEQLISLAKTTQGPIWVKCFPRVPWIAEEAVHLGAGKPASTVVWKQPDAPAAVFCYQK